MMYGDDLLAVATARHGARVAAAERAGFINGYPAPSRRRRITWVRRQPYDVAAACHGHGNDANNVAASSVAPLARSRIALE